MSQTGSFLGTLEVVVVSEMESEMEWMLMKGKVAFNEEEIHSMHR